MPDLPDPEATRGYTPAVPAGERFAPGDLLADRYRVVAPLGKGGMGEVFRADDLTLGQPVALKFLPAHVAADPDRLARFRKEVAAARRVSHPNVCRVYDIADHGGQPFLTMEFIDGEDLASVLRRLGRLPEEKAVEVTRQLCSALAAVHGQGLLHRDLKPANVMLDGRGQVRLTDFGLAVAAEDLSASDVRSGTPLYQAPEQRAGREVTARSDLYALGLVLYEVFTGKRAFPGGGRGGPPERPTSHVSTLAPAVERVILQCLEPDPAARPKSAAAVLAGLPGGDPLAAALAAGETPSPRLVAAAGEAGVIRPWLGAALFAGVVALLLVSAGLRDRYKAYRHVPLPAPAVLDDKARQVVRALGYTEAPADTFGGFEMPPEHRDYILANGGQPAVPVAEMESCRPPVLVYWHRQSPWPLVPVRVNDEGNRLDRLTARNPPTSRPGMRTVWLDTRGRLVGFLAVPDPASANPGGPLDWGPVLQLAGLDGPGVLRPDPDASPTPPVFADQTQAWEGAYPERPDLPVLVEAAAYRGRLVYFRLTHTGWGVPARDRSVPEIERDSRPYLVGYFLYTALMYSLFLFAVRNARRGRADVRGALVVGGTVLGFQMLFWTLAGGHFPDPEVFPPLFVNEFAMAVHVAAVGVASYLALEPVIRRRCPHRLTAWARLANGRWRDPLVGRDVLVGVLAGALVTLDWSAVPLFPSRWGPTAVPPYSFTRPLGDALGLMGLAVGSVWISAGMFALLWSVTRREWAAIAVVWVLLVLSLVGNGTPVAQQLFGVLRVSVSLAVFLRFGLLAVVAFAYTIVLLTQSAPLTLDTQAWYFGAGLTFFAVLTGLAGYGAYTATGGRLFGGVLAGDD